MSFGNAGLNKILRALNIELCFLNPQEIKILATIFQTFWPGISSSLFSPEHFLAGVPQSTLWETMTFFSNHITEPSLWDRFYAGRIISLFQKIRFMINHNVRRDCQVHISVPTATVFAQQCSVSRCWVNEWNKLMIHN